MFTKSDHIYFPFHPPGTLVGQSGAPFSRGTTEAQELVRGQVSPPSSQADVPSEGTPVGTSGLGVPAAIHTFPEVTAPRQRWGGVAIKGRRRMVGNVGVWGLSWISLGGVGAPKQPGVHPISRYCPRGHVRAAGASPDHTAGIGCACAAPLAKLSCAK